MSVAVGAGKSRVNLQFADITAEQIPPVAFQVIISFIRRCNQGGLFFCCVFTVYAVKMLVIPAKAGHGPLQGGIQYFLFSGCPRIKYGAGSSLQRHDELFFTIDLMQEQVFDLNNG
jgi:hypothetical protein